MPNEGRGYLPVMGQPRRQTPKPEKAWIDDITTAADRCGIPVFMKDSLIPIVGAENMRRVFPWSGY